MSDEKERNALAELAEEILGIVTYIYYGSGQCGVAEARKIAKVQRIVAELAKVSEGSWEEDYRGKFYLCRLESRVIETAVGKCRAIAEEGDGDGK